MEICDTDTRNSKKKKTGERQTHAAKPEPEEVPRTIGISSNKYLSMSGPTYEAKEKASRYRGPLCGSQDVAPMCDFEVCALVAIWNASYSVCANNHSSEAPFVEAICSPPLFSAF